MLDLKVLKSALEQLEEERKIPKEKIIDAIEQSLAAAYKKEYGKRGQIIRAKFDLEVGTTEFYQVKKLSMTRLYESYHLKYSMKKTSQKRATSVCVTTKNIISLSMTHAR